MTAPPPPPWNEHHERVLAQHGTFCYALDAKDRRVCHGCSGFLPDHRHSCPREAALLAVEEIKRQRAEIARLTAAVEAAQKALKQIAEHPHCSYYHPENYGNGSPESNYHIGVADGHRCAATVAKQFLAERATGEGQ